MKYLIIFMVSVISWFIGWIQGYVKGYRINEIYKNMYLNDEQKINKNE